MAATGFGVEKKNFGGVLDPGLLASRAACSDTLTALGVVS
jgi:hypothetical protein